MRPFIENAVAAHFDSYPSLVRRKMLALRELIFETAAHTVGVGDVQETLKWGEPAYVTVRPRSGSTIRIDWKPRAPSQYAVYFNCRTTLVETFRAFFPNDFAFEGNRALILSIEQRMPKEALTFCIASALVYHAARKTDA